MMTRAKMTGEFALVKKKKRKKNLWEGVYQDTSVIIAVVYLFFKKMSKSHAHARPTACTGLTLGGASLAFLDISLS